MALNKDKAKKAAAKEDASADAKPERDTATSRRRGKTFERRGIEKTGGAK